MIAITLCLFLLLHAFLPGLYLGIILGYMSAIVTCLQTQSQDSLVPVITFLHAGCLESRPLPALSQAFHQHSHPQHYQTHLEQWADLCCLCPCCVLGMLFLCQAVCLLPLPLLNHSQCKQPMCIWKYLPLWLLLLCTSNKKIFSLQYQSNCYPLLVFLYSSLWSFPHGNLLLPPSFSTISGYPSLQQIIIVFILPHFCIWPLERMKNKTDNKDAWQFSWVDAPDSPWFWWRLPSCAIVSIWIKMQAVEADLGVCIFAMLYICWQPLQKCDVLFLSMLCLCYEISSLFWWKFI